MENLYLNDKNPHKEGLYLQTSKNLTGHGFWSIQALIKVDPLN